MALIKCDECGKGVSDKAAACPNCGNPMRGDLTSQETDVKRGVQRATWRYEIGKVVALAGMTVAVVIGVALGSWPIGLGGVFLALVVGIAIQYS